MNQFALDLEFVERFWQKVDRSQPGGCWSWTASKGRRYGDISYGGKSLIAHRVAYVLQIGPIPDGMVLDHLCRNQKCVNPAHLQPVESKENILRGIGWGAQNARKTHCPKGHPYEGENLRIRPSGRRECLTCKRESAKRLRKNK